MKVSSISTNYQQNNTSFKARTVKVNALTKFVNTFSKAGRTANQQMKKISEAYGEMDVYQKKLNNGMIALQHINIGEKGLFRSRRNDSQIPYTPTWERLILITKEGDIQGEKRLEINTDTFRLLDTHFPILKTYIAKILKEKPDEYSEKFVKKFKITESADEFIFTRVTKDGYGKWNMLETLKTNKDYNGAILDEWLFRNVSYKWRNLARKEALGDGTDLYTFRPEPQREDGTLVKLNWR